jgi:hypothetical protein
MFQIADNPPSTTGKTQQETSGEEIRTTDNPNDGWCGDKI